MFTSKTLPAGERLMSHKILDRKAVSKLQAIILILVVAVCAVGGTAAYYLTLPESDTSTPTPSPTSTPTPTAAPTPTASPSLTVVDYAGRTVTFDGPIESIASNYPISTEAILFLGGEDKIIGCDGSNYANAFMTSLYPKIAQATDIGYPWNLNMEQVVALEPSVFVTAGNNKDAADQLATLGVPTVCLSFETPEDFNNALTIIGELLGNEEEAATAVQYFTSMTQSITDQTQNLADSSKPTVMFASYGAQKKYALQTPGEGMLQNNMIEMSGGISVSADQPGGWNQISMEQVAAWNPDIVIVTSYASNVSTTDLKNQIMSDDAWNVTNAKLDGKVYAFAQDWEAWDSPTPKWILGLCWLGTHIQPDLFASMDLTNAASSFYQNFYGISYADAGVQGDV
jgi:iron complex transport system substrate-binding protein